MYESIEELALVTERPKKPEWLKVKLPTGEEYRKVRNLVSENKLNVRQATEITDAIKRGNTR